MNLTARSQQIRLNMMELCVDILIVVIITI